MTDTRPTLYLSRLLPDPVMAIVWERFQLVQDPQDALPAPSALREGLCQADAAIVTLGDRIDAETIHAATRLKFWRTMPWGTTTSIVPLRDSVV